MKNEKKLQNLSTSDPKGQFHRRRLD